MPLKGVREDLATALMRPIWAAIDAYSSTTVGPSSHPRAGTTVISYHSASQAEPSSVMRMLADGASSRRQRTCSLCPLVSPVRVFTTDGTLPPTACSSDEALLSPAR
eukprot:scaffold3744_cov33-Tisochrysis_lutea.AAC.1